MVIKFYNDTGRELRIHRATYEQNKSVNGNSELGILKPREVLSVELKDRVEGGFIKLWEHDVIVVLPYRD